MADRRMFCKEIIEGDSFSAMPAESQVLYIHLNMYADDYGFIGNPRQVMRSVGASDDSLKILIARKFVLTFSKDDNFIVLIKHWKMHNYIRSDRVKESRYKEFLRDVYYDENDSYSMTSGDGHRPCLPSGNHVSTNCQSSDSQLPTEDRLGKDSIGKDSIGYSQDSVGESVRGGETPSPPASGSEEKIEELKKRIDQAKTDGQFPVFISYKHILSQVYGIDYGGEWEGKREDDN